MRFRPRLQLMPARGNIREPRAVVVVVLVPHAPTHHLQQVVSPNGIGPGSAVRGLVLEDGHVRILQAVVLQGVQGEGRRAVQPRGHAVHVAVDHRHGLPEDRQKHAKQVSKEGVLEGQAHEAPAVQELHAQIVHERVAPRAVDVARRHVVDIALVAILCFWVCGIVQNCAEL